MSIITEVRVTPGKPAPGWNWIEVTIDGERFLSANWYRDEDVVARVKKLATLEVES
jgi:hypothetical protein